MVAYRFSPASPQSQLWCQEHSNKICILPFSMGYGQFSPSSPSSGRESIFLTNNQLAQLSEAEVNSFSFPLQIYHGPLRVYFVRLVTLNFLEDPRMMHLLTTRRQQLPQGTYTLEVSLLLRLPGLKQSSCLSLCSS